MAKQYSPEVLALRDRVKLGNEKLFKAWQQIRELNSAEWSYQMELWYQAGKKLNVLCIELNLKGYGDCLYLENGKKTKSCLDNADGFWCQVCPSSIRYWDKELMSLGGANNEQRKITS